jgi:hypothetical protein
MIKLIIPIKNVTRRHVAYLHTALRNLNLEVVDEEISGKRIGKTTAKAIKEIQKRNKLAATGKLNTKTIEALNTKFFDVHHTRSTWIGILTGGSHK